MTCQEFQELAAALALGALDPDERREAEQHLAEPTHHGCGQALARARDTVAALAEALPRVRPGEDVWRAIAIRARIAARPAARRVRRPLVWVASAAAAAAVLLWTHERSLRRDEAAGLAVAQAHLETAQENLEAARRSAGAEAAEAAALAAQVRELQGAVGGARELAALLASSDSRIVPLAPLAPGGARAVAVLSLKARRTVILSTALQPIPAKDYQLWVIRGKAPPSPAGFLRFVGGGLAVGDVDPVLLATAPDALAVSLEPAGGSPSPTEVLMVGKLAG